MAIGQSLSSPWSSLCWPPKQRKWLVKPSAMSRCWWYRNSEGRDYPRLMQQDVGSQYLSRRRNIRSIPARKAAWGIYGQGKCDSICFTFTPTYGLWLWKARLSRTIHRFGWAEGYPVLCHHEIRFPLGWGMHASRLEPGMRSSADPFARIAVRRRQEEIPLWGMFSLALFVDLLFSMPCARQISYVFWVLLAIDDVKVVHQK